MAGPMVNGVLHNKQGDDMSLLPEISSSNDNKVQNYGSVIVREQSDEEEQPPEPSTVRLSGKTKSMEILNRARLLLYVSHFSAQFSEASWQFALILFLAAFVQYQSLFYVSTYGIMSNLAVCLFSSTTSKNFIDRSHNRLRSARYLIWFENSCVIIASVFCYLLLRKTILEHNARQQEQNLDATSTQQSTDNLISYDFYTILYLIGIHLFGPTAQILDGVFLVAMERDWVVVMGHVASNLTAIEKEQQNQNNSDDKSNNGSTTKMSDTSWLVETNVTMKQIDLSCKVLSPAIAGFAVDFFGYNRLHIGAIFIGFINILSLVMEYLCTEIIYNSIPELSVKSSSDAPSNGTNSSSHDKNNKNGTHYQSLKDSDDNNHSPDRDIDKEKQKLITESIPTKDSIMSRCLKCLHMESPPPLLLYLQQPVCCAGFGNSLLYFNPLTFGGLMSAYLLYRGMSMSKVGFWRGVSALVGLVGTFGYKVSVKRMDVVSTGMWSIMYQLIFISFSMGAMFIANDWMANLIFVLGVCASRVGLYIYKISVTQLMQLNIPANIRGVIGGTQNSLNAFFQLLQFGLCLIYSNPQDFVIVVAAGYITVIIATVIYGVGIYYRSSLFIQSANKSDKA